MFQIIHDEQIIKSFESECEALFYLKKISNAKQWHEINWQAYRLKEID